jgi:hypothetical protein
VTCAVAATEITPEPRATCCTPRPRASGHRPSPRTHYCRLARQMERHSVPPSARRAERNTSRTRNSKDTTYLQPASSARRPACGRSDRSTVLSIYLSGSPLAHRRCAGGRPRSSTSDDQPWRLTPWRRGTCRTQSRPGVVPRPGAHWTHSFVGPLMSMIMSNSVSTKSPQGPGAAGTRGTS